MYKDGSIVSLIENKSHGEGEDAVTLSSGTCGMIRRTNRKTDNNHLYIVDFGPYGQWYCFHNELSGDDTEGWDGAEECVPMEEPVLRFRERDEDEPKDTDETQQQVIDVERDIQRRMEEIEKGIF